MGILCCDGDLTLRWFKATILPYTQGERALLCVDSFSGRETEEFMEAAKENNVDVVIILGGCTSKVQLLYVWLNKPFKSMIKNGWGILNHKWLPTKFLMSLLLPLRTLAAKWVKAGHDYLDEHEEMVKKSFLVRGLTNALDG